MKIHENTNIIHIYTSLNFKLKLRTVLFSMTETGRFSGMQSVEDTFRKDNWISSWKASNCILAPSSVIVKPIISWWEISDSCIKKKLEIATIEDSFRNTCLHKLQMSFTVISLKNIQTQYLKKKPQERVLDTCLSVHVSVDLNFSITSPTFGNDRRITSD